jgi:hypothetical protein
LDRLQTTAWRINRPVLELVGGAFDESDAEKAAQVRHLLGLPDPPPDWAVLAGERWAVKKMATLRRNRDTLAVAEECLDPEAIHATVLVTVHTRARDTPATGAHPSLFNY